MCSQEFTNISKKPVLTWYNCYKNPFFHPVQPSHRKRLNPLVLVTVCLAFCCRCALPVCSSTHIHFCAMNAWPSEKFQTNKPHHKPCRVNQNYLNHKLIFLYELIPHAPSPKRTLHFNLHLEIKLPHISMCIHHLCALCKGSTLLCSIKHKVHHQCSINNRNK